jgi:hypothetical protein
MLLLLLGQLVLPELRALQVQQAPRDRLAQRAPLGQLGKLGLQAQQGRQDLRG